MKNKHEETRMLRELHETEDDLRKANQRARRRCSSVGTSTECSELPPEVAGAAGKKVPSQANHRLPTSRKTTDIKRR